MTDCRSEWVFEKICLEALWGETPWTGSSVAGPGPPGVVKLIFQVEMTLPTMTAFFDTGELRAVVY